MQKNKLATGFFIVCLALSACSAKTESAPKSDQETKKSAGLKMEFDAGAMNVDPSGKDYGELWGQPDQVLEELYKICYLQPETLAATISAFPSIVYAEGVRTKHSNRTEIDPIELDQLISFGENGGEVQDKLLDALKRSLTDKQTKVKFVYTNGWQEMYYMFQYDKTLKMTPSTIDLVAIPIYQRVAPQVLITITDQDGNEETGLFDLTLGLQRCIPFKKE